MFTTFTLVLALAPQTTPAPAAAPAAAPTPPTLTRVATIDLPKVTGRLEHMAFDPANKRLWVAAVENDTIEIVDVQNGRHERSIAGTARPQGVAFAPEAGVVLVAGGAKGTLDVFDAKTCERKASVAIGENADNVRWDAAHNRAIVGYGSGALALVDAAAWKVASTVKLDGHPEGFQLDDKGKMAFVNVADARAIVQVDLEKSEVVRSWKLVGLGSNFAMAFDPTQRRLLVPCRSPSLLVSFAIDDAGDAPCGLTSPIATDVDDVYRDPALDRVYLSSGLGMGFIDVLEAPTPARACAADKANFVRKERIPSAAGARTSLLVPELRRYFLAVPQRPEQKAAVWVYETPAAR